MYADRDRYIGDPAFITVPVERLLDPGLPRRARAAHWRARRSRAAARHFCRRERARDATREASGTSHFVVMDSAGNVATMTTTVESVFGSGRTVEGFVSTISLTDFSYLPTDEHGALANAVQGGKRRAPPLAPIIVLRSRRAFFRGARFAGRLLDPGVQREDPGRHTGLGALDAGGD